MIANGKTPQDQGLAIPPASHMQDHAADAASLMKNEIIPLSQSALSQQLARLRQQGLVKTRRESQTIFYSLACGPADRVIQLLHDIYCGAADCAARE
jgi:DNA-binding transcriptional ArsR family regulator